eukprot:TRINITY_DN3242_c0_g1_i2.p1 TRINITY_DN3242_c0_g1~~TRINITY_DN3242_c0_g1_i2.p1  ORF type:complete len:854 (+),score=235.69 TRINITY_DN3242_c0_g1_i2:47-2608(+)
MIHPTFHLSLNTPIDTGLLTTGSFDGDNLSIICGSSTGKIYVFNPHNRDESMDLEKQQLNINQRIIRLDTGKLHSHGAFDTLFYVCENSITAFNIEENKDIYFIQPEENISDAIFCEVVDSDPLMYLATDGFLTGYDATGEECSWNVFNSGINSLSSLPYHKERYGITRENEGKQGLQFVLANIHESSPKQILQMLLEPLPQVLVVGLINNVVQVLNSNNTVLEQFDVQSALKKAIGLAAIVGLEGFLLESESFGVRYFDDILWTVDSHDEVTDIAFFDITESGLPQLVVGTKSGLLKFFDVVTGKELCSVNLESSIVALTIAKVADRVQLLVGTTRGDLFGFTPSIASFESLYKDVIDDILPNSAQIQMKNSANELERETRLRKQLKEQRFDLLSKERALEAQSKKTKIVGPNSAPKQPEVKISLSHNYSLCSLDLILSVDKGVIVGVSLFSDEAFLNGNQLWQPPVNSPPLKQVSVPLQLSTNRKIQITGDVFVATASSQSCASIVPLNIHLPCFPMFAPMTNISSTLPLTEYSIIANDRLSRFIVFICEIFEGHYNLMLTLNDDCTCENPIPLANIKSNTGFLTSNNIYSCSLGFTDLEAQQKYGKPLNNDDFFNFELTPSQVIKQRLEQRFDGDLNPLSRYKLEDTTQNPTLVVISCVDLSQAPKDKISKDNLPSSGLLLSIKTNSTGVMSELRSQMMKFFVSFEKVQRVFLPVCLDILQNVISNILTYHDRRVSYHLDLTEQLQTIKQLVLRLENERILENYKALPPLCQQLANANEDAQRKHLTRLTNHFSLVINLKYLSKLISELAEAIHNPQTRQNFVVNCRKCIQTNQLEELLKLAQQTMSNFN